VNHYWPAIPRIGNVVHTRHAQENAELHHITEAQVRDVLHNGEETPDGNTTRLEKDGVRIVLIKPTPFKGARLAITMYRIQAQAKATQR
jgi:hypothetical protein